LARALCDDGPARRSKIVLESGYENETARDASHVGDD